MNRGAFYYWIFPMVILASLLQSTVAPRLEIGGVKPDLVLLLVLIGALIYGGRPGLFWGFIGGIGLDLFSGGPMGSSSLALMAAALVAGVGHRTLSRYNLIVPLAVSVAGTAVYGGTYVAILTLLNALEVLDYLLPVWPTLQYVIAPAVLYNGALMLLMMPLLNRVPESQDI